VLKITVVTRDDYDEEQNKFVTESRDVVLEHSLLSLSKWEAKYEKPFLGNPSLDSQALADYIEFMNQDEEPLGEELIASLSQDNLSLISEYIESKQTATWFSSIEDEGAATLNRQVITSELIYYWMFSYRIPKECETWHLNRLITLIRVFGEQNKPKQKISPQKQAEMYRDLNEKRKKELNTSG